MSYIWQNGDLITAERLNNTGNPFSDLYNLNNIIQTDPTDNSKYITKADIQDLLNAMPSTICLTYSAEDNGDIRVDALYYRLIQKITINGAITGLLYTLHVGDPAITETGQGITIAKEQVISINDNLVWDSAKEIYTNGNVTPVLPSL